MTTTLVIDATNHVTRDWFATPDARVGQRFIRRVRLLCESLAVERCSLCFDTPGEDSFRLRAEPTYKANRGPKDPRLLRALDEAVSRDWGHGVACYQVPGFEADDLVATVTDRDLADGHRVVMSSTDKDLRQCLWTGHVTQMTAWALASETKFAFTWMTAERLLNEYGVTPAQWLDVQTLAGDPGDNVPGCPGIGEKSAITLIRAAGTLQRLLHNPFLVPGTKTRNKLIAFRPHVERARRLVELRRDVSIKTLTDGIADPVG